MTSPTTPPPTGGQPYPGTGYPDPPGGYGYPPPRRRRRPWVLPVAIGGAVLAVGLALATCAAFVASVGGTTATTRTGPVDTTPARPGAPGHAPPQGAVPAAFGAEVTVSEDGQPVAVVTVAVPETAPTLVDGALTPDSGVFVMFSITVTNTSAAARSYNMFDFYVRNGAGERYQPTIGREPSLSSGTLNPGETVSGWLTFDAGEHGTLAYTSNAFVGASVAEWAF